MGLFYVSDTSRLFSYLLMINWVAIFEHEFHEWCTNQNVVFVAVIVFFF